MRRPDPRGSARRCRSGRGARRSSTARVPAVQHARSLLHECRRRLPGAHRRRRIADRVRDRNGAVAPSWPRRRRSHSRRGTCPENPPRRAARNSTPMRVLARACVRKGDSRTCPAQASRPVRGRATLWTTCGARRPLTISSSQRYPPGSSLARRRRLSTGAIDKASVLLAVLEAIIVAMEREEARRT